MALLLTHENEIRGSVSKMYLTNEQITNAWLEDSSIKTNVQLVANTYMDISYDRLTKMLSLINAQLNYRQFRYYQKYPDKRVGFHCYHERVEGNTHSHFLLRVPPKNRHNLIFYIDEIEALWKEVGARNKRSGTKFQLQKDLNVEDEKKCTSYTIKKKYHVVI